MSNLQKFDINVALLGLMFCFAIAGMCTIGFGGVGLMMLKRNVEHTQYHERHVREGQKHIANIVDKSEERGALFLHLQRGQTESTPIKHRVFRDEFDQYRIGDSIELYCINDSCVSADFVELSSSRIMGYLLYAGGGSLILTLVFGVAALIEKRRNGLGRNWKSTEY